MSIEYYASKTIDGSMKSPDQSFQTVLAARSTFLRGNHIDPENTTLLHVTYENDNFCRYDIVLDHNKGDGIVRTTSIEADALVVTRPGHALLLPLADCVGSVIHDPTKNILMVSHLGRHNLEQFGGTRCIEYLTSKLNVNPHDLVIWLSPAAGQKNYPLHAFNNRGMHEVAIEQLIDGGVSPKNIQSSFIDTTTNLDYFSHSQFLKGNRDSDGRFCIVATMN